MPKVTTSPNPTQPLPCTPPHPEGSPALPRIGVMLGTGEHTTHWSQLHSWLHFSASGNILPSAMDKAQNKVLITNMGGTFVSPMLEGS